MKSKIIFLIIISFLLVLSSFVSADTVTEEFNDPPTGTFSIEFRYGYYITVTEKRLFEYAMLEGSCTATRCELYNEAKELIASGTITARNCTLSGTNYLNTGTGYYLVSDNSGAAFNMRYKSGVSYPYRELYINYVAGANDEGGLAQISGLSFNFFSITTTSVPGPPTHSNFQNNASDATRINGVVNWSIDMVDGEGLSFYIFAHNNSGTLRNVSNGTLGEATSAFVNKTITITQARDNYICGQFWFNDTDNNINQTLLTDSNACFTVANTAPTTPDVTHPEDGKSYSDTELNINFTSTDLEGDTITYDIYINNTLNITTTTNVTDWNAYNGYYNLTVTARDNSDSSANSSVIHFRVNITAPDTCSCPSPSANWDVSCIDNCSITSNCNIVDYNLSVRGATGSFEILANITVDQFGYELGCSIKNALNDNKVLRIKVI